MHGWFVGYRRQPKNCLITVCIILVYLVLHEWVTNGSTIIRMHKSLKPRWMSRKRWANKDARDALLRPVQSRAVRLRFLFNVTDLWQRDTLETEIFSGLGWFGMNHFCGQVTKSRLECFDSLSFITKLKTENYKQK